MIWSHHLDDQVNLGDLRQAEMVGQEMMEHHQALILHPQVMSVTPVALAILTDMNQRHSIGMGDLP